MYTKDELYDIIIELNIANEKEIELVICINGYSIDTLNDIVYARTGYHTIEQLVEYEYEEDK